jgi:tetratricopeptide (TPR) repeat protein
MRPSGSIFKMRGVFAMTKISIKKVTQTQFLYWGTFKAKSKSTVLASVLAVVFVSMFASAGYGQNNCDDFEGRDALYSRFRESWKNGNNLRNPEAMRTAQSAARLYVSRYGQCPDAREQVEWLRSWLAKNGGSQQAYDELRETVASCIRNPNCKVDYDGVIARLSGIIAADPSFGDAYYWSANLYMNKQNYQACIRDFTSYIRVAASPSPHAFIDRGGCHILTGDKKNAIEDFTKAIGNRGLSSGWRADAHWKRGIQYFALGEYDKALADFSDYLVENPDSTSGWRAMAQTLKKLGMKNDEKKARQKCKSLGGIGCNKDEFKV